MQHYVASCVPEGLHKCLLCYVAGRGMQQNSHLVANRITKRLSSALIDNALGIKRASASGSNLAAQMASLVIVSTEGTGLSILDAPYARLSGQVARLPWAHRTRL